MRGKQRSSLESKINNLLSGSPILGNSGSGPIALSVGRDPVLVTPTAFMAGIAFSQVIVNAYHLGRKG